MFLEYKPYFGFLVETETLITTLMLQGSIPMVVVVVVVASSPLAFSWFYFISTISNFRTPDRIRTRDRCPGPAASFDTLRVQERREIFHMKRRAW